MRPTARLLLLALPHLWPALAPHLPAQAPAPADLRQRIETLGADLADLERRYDVPMSPLRQTRLDARYQEELQALAAIDFAALPREARIDWLLLDGHVRRERERLVAEAARDQELAPLLPFAPAIVRTCEAWLRLQPVAPETAAADLAALAEAATAAQRTNLPAGGRPTAPAPRLLRAAERLAELRAALAEWFRFHDGYDPQFSWWARQPHTAATKALGDYEQALRGAAAGDGGDASLVGDPIGDAGLRRELAAERIPYTPAELLAIAEREFAWCDAEADAAARAMGCTDWRQALARVKERHRAPGEQPALIQALAQEAIDFVEQRDLLTVPASAKECWRMRMLSPQAQRVNPFFLGGDTIQVSFPTDTMTHAEKLQSLRSNNEHFCRATVGHELIPGHWLQEWSQARYRTWRRPFATPFWIEGWSLYWEMRFYELGLPHGPEDRIGMLYWRKHRCARIVFSLRFHLGEWTPQQCIAYLVDRVGHEPAAATGEVRRSISGGYGPLYQAAYMLGGLQLRALHDESVGPGKRSEKSFHDAVLQQNAIPIALVRLALGDQEVTAAAADGWRFADPR